MPQIWFAISPPKQVIVGRYIGSVVSTLWKITCYVLTLGRWLGGLRLPTFCESLAGFIRVLVCRLEILEIIVVALESVSGWLPDRGGMTISIAHEVRYDVEHYE